MKSGVCSPNLGDFILPGLKMAGLEYGTPVRGVSRSGHWRSYVFGFPFCTDWPVLSLMPCKLATETSYHKVPPKTTASLAKVATKTGSTSEVLSGGSDILQGTVCGHRCVCGCRCKEVWYVSNQLFLSQGCSLSISSLLSGQAQM